MTEHLLYEIGLSDGTWPETGWLPWAILAPTWLGLIAWGEIGRWWCRRQLLKLYAKLPEFLARQREQEARR
jgi:hypothetical protein